MKITLAVYLFLFKLIFFETLIIFFESTRKLITEIFDLQKATIILIMMAQVLLFDVFFQKRLAP